MADKKSAGKKILITGGVVVVVLVACLLGLRGLLNSNGVKDKIKQTAIQAVAENLSMQLVFEDDFQVTIFPDLGLYVRGISLTPIEGKTPTVPLKNLSVAQADVEVGLWSLLGGNPEVKVISLRDTALTLPKQLLQQEIQLKFSQVILSDFAALTGGRLELKGQAIWPGNLVDADISLAASLNGEKQIAIDMRNIAINAALAGKQPVKLRGGGQIEVQGRKPLADIKALEDISNIGLQKVSLAMDDLVLDAQGQLSLDNMQGKITMQLNGPAKGLLHFLGYEFASASAGRSLSLALDVSGQDNMWKINKLDANLDDIKLQTTGQYKHQQVLELDGGLDLASLKLDDYQLKPLPRPATPATDTASSGSATSAAPPAPAAPAGQAGLALPADLVNSRLNLAISARQISSGQVGISDLAATLRADKGIWHLQPVTAKLMGGSLNSDMNMDFNHMPPRAQAKGNLSALQIKALAPDLGGQINDVAFNVSSLANDKFLNNLGGSMSFNASGISSGPFVLPPPLGTLNALTIHTASGSFSIRGGVASTSNLQAAGTNLKVSGQGSVNLPQQSLAMDVLATLPGVSIKGVDTIPLKVSGSLGKPNVAIDAAKLAELTAKGMLREQLGERIPDLPPGVGNLLQGIGGGR